MRRHLIAIAAISLISAFAYAEENVVAGLGTAKLDGNLQFWLVNDSTGTNLDNRLRRAEIKLSGSVREGTRWFVMADPAKTPKSGAVAQTNDNKILQDFGVAFALNPETEIIFGQFKIPTTSEGLDGAAELLFPERSYVARAFGDRREPGAMITYTMSDVKFSLMESNGQGTNVDDTTTRNEKDLHFRVDGTLTKDLKVGAFMTAGDSGTQSKAHYGVNARGTIGSLLARLDGVRADDAGVWTTGGVLDLAYTIDERWQPAFRLDTIDGVAAAGGPFTATATTIGVNYYLLKHNSKLQASYSQLNNMQGGSASTPSAPGTYAPGIGVTGSVAILAAQASF